MGELPRVRFEASDIPALVAELQHALAERVQLETLAAQRADEIHRLNNWLTAVLLERDNAIRDAKQHYAVAQDRAEEIHKLNNRLTACQLERDALRRHVDSQGD